MIRISDRPFSGQVRSPADRVVADTQPLYEKYLREQLEAKAS